jgi:XisH protein
MGQAWNYKVVLEEQQPDRVLYLAIPADIYEEFFTRRLAANVSDADAIKLACI